MSTNLSIILKRTNKVYHEGQAESTMSDSSEDERDLMLLSEWLSDWSSSESEEEERKGRLYKTRVNYFNILNIYEFQVRFRVDKPTVEQLLIEINPHLRVTGARNYGVPPLQQLLLTLRFYAVGTMLVSVADFSGVSKSTACRIVRDVSKALACLYSDKIKFHDDTMYGFYAIAQFPRILGAVDATHIRIQNPRSQIGEQFRNRNGNFSVNVQCVCDAELRFLNVEARWPGSVDDATIFNNSQLRAQLESGLYGNRWLLGDNEYPLRSYLLTPIVNPQTAGELNYNEAHSQSWNCIERCINVWKNRFPVVAQTMRLSLSRVFNVVIATAVLHNISLTNNLPEIPPEVEITQEDNIPIPNIIEEEDQTERANIIANHFDFLT